VVGVILALWGINLMNSLGQQMAGAVGIQDYTGAVAAVGGSLLAIIGLALAVTGRSTSQQAPSAYRCRYAKLRSNWATKSVFGALRSLSRGSKADEPSLNQASKGKECLDEEVSGLRRGGGSDARKCRFCGFVFPAEPAE